MFAGLKCARCHELLEEASSAVIKHLRAQSRLDMARCHHETDVVPALREVLDESSLNRSTAIKAYKVHSATHRAARPPSLVTKRFRGIEVRGPVSGQNPEHQSDQARDSESHHDRDRRNRNSDVRKKGHS